MNCLNLESHDPFFNLATEEYLLKNRKEDFLILGINDRSIIIGKHQIANREADTKFANKNKIPVIRRISGGGTVFHDQGNLNFSFINLSEPGKQVDFHKYTLPVIRFLSLLGVDAKFEGKNDLKVKELKISGNAEHVHHNRVLHHGTLLFNTQLDVLRNSLRKDTRNYTTRAIASHPSPVMNLKDSLKTIKDIFEFRSEMMDFFLKDLPEAKLYTLTALEVNEIESLAGSKYRTWEWNYAYGPEYHFNNSLTINGKRHTCRLFVKDGIIWECEIEGSDEMLAAGKKLIGCKHMVADMIKVFRNENILLHDKNIYEFF